MSWGTKEKRKNENRSKGKPLMEIAHFKERLKSLDLSGCYVFAGEEDYLKKYYLGALCRAVITDETIAPFNYIVFDGEEGSFARMTDAVKAPPLMSDYKLIVWKYPGFDKMKESDLVALEELAELISSPEHSYAIAVFLVADGELDLGTAKRPSKLVKRLDGRVHFLNFERSTEAQLISWLKKHFDAEGVGISQAALSLLIARVGRSMTVLKNELDKLSSFAHSHGISVISDKEVREIASYSADSEEYAFSNAILSLNRKDAYLALDDMKSKRVDPIIIVSMISRIFSELLSVASMLSEGLDADDIEKATKMHSYKVKMYMGAAKKFGMDKLRAALDEICRADAGLKYGSITGYTAIELLIGKCL